MITDTLCREGGSAGPGQCAQWEGIGRSTEASQVRILPARPWVAGSVLGPHRGACGTQPVAVCR